MLIGIIIGVVLLVALVVFFLATYTVVDPNEAHIVVFMGSGRKVYSPREVMGQKPKSAYFFIPFLMKRVVLPLNNVKMEREKFELKDKSVAPFVCEIATWLRIVDPSLTVEKLDLSEGFGNAVRSTLQEQIAGIARAVAMKQEILELMADRLTFGKNVAEEVNGSLKEWGLELVKLEVVEFTDADSSTVIQDMEKKRQAEVRADSRKVIAEQNKQAEIVEAEAQKVAGIAREDSQRGIELARIERERETSVRTEEANATVAEKTKLSNTKKVEANRAAEVGNAQVAKEAQVEVAKGEAEAEFLRGKAVADVQREQGNAEAEVLRSQGIARAEALEKQAEAQQKFNDAALGVEKIKAAVEIKKAEFEAMGKALEKADIKINNIASDGKGGSLFGLPLNASTGANIDQLMQTLGTIDGEGNLKDKVSKVADAVSEASNAVQGKRTQKSA